MRQIFLISAMLILATGCAGKYRTEILQRPDGMTVEQGNRINAGCIRQSTQTSTGYRTVGRKTLVPIQRERFRPSMYVLCMREQGIIAQAKRG